MKNESAYISQLKNEKRKTSNIRLAKLTSQKTGKPAAFYLSPAIKEMACKMYPELKKPAKINGKA
jgi:hypothetical protein